MQAPPCAGDSGLSISGAAGRTLDGSSAPMRPICGFSSSAARSCSRQMHSLRCSELHPHLGHLDRRISRRGPSAAPLTAPEGGRLGGRFEARGLHQLGGLLESGRDLGRVVRVAAERHRFAAGLVPPSQHRQAGTDHIPAGRVDLEHQVTTRRGREDGPQLLLEILLAVAGPVALGVVEVRERLKGLTALDHRECFGEVGLSEYDRIYIRQFRQLAGVNDSIPQTHTVHRAKDVIQLARTTMSTQYWPGWTLTKSAWSVKAIAGSPISSARSQLFSIEPRGPS